MSGADFIGGIGPTLPGTGGGGSGTVTNVSGVNPIVVSSPTTTPVISFAPTGEAQGDIVYRNATAWVRLAAGTAGQVLSTNGAAANPSYISLPIATLVYDPAGVAAGNVYTSLALLATAAAAIVGPKNIFVRLRGANRTVPAGAYDFGFFPIFIGDPAEFIFKLIWPTGTTMAAFPAIIQDLYLESASAASIVTTSSATAKYYQLKGTAQVGATTSSNFYTDTGFDTVNVDMTESAALYASSIGRVFAVAGDLTVSAYGENYTDDNTFFGGVSETLVNVSAASSVSQTQTGGAALAVFNLEAAQQVNYVPATVANWTTVPTEVKGALDTLAAMHTLAGNTAGRPATPSLGLPYFDTTIGQPVWWNGAAWVDAAGVPS